MHRKSSSVVSRPLDGELNRDFKFGGKPSSSPIKQDASEDAHLTLSDIIPSPVYAHSLSMGMLEPDGGVPMNSIYAKAVEISPLPPHTRFNLDASTRGILPGSLNVHHRNSSAFGSFCLRRFDMAPNLTTVVRASIRLLQQFRGTTSMSPCSVPHSFLCTVISFLLGLLIHSTIMHPSHCHCRNGLGPITSHSRCRPVLTMQTS